MKDDDREAYLELLRSYQGKRDLYTRLTVWMEEQVRDLASSLGLHPVVVSRTKTLKSLAGKYLRKRARGVPSDLAGSLREYTDLSGIRAIMHTPGEVFLLKDAVESRFRVDHPNCLFMDTRSRPTSFVYDSEHLIISVKEENDRLAWPPEDADEIRAIRAELQIRTFCQHSYAEVSHELDYKGQFSPPATWKRKLAIIKASLESCDMGYEEIYRDFRRITSSYNRDFSPQEAEMLAEKWELLLDIEPHNPQVIHELIKLYLSWDTTEARIRLAALLEGEEAYLTEYPALLRDAGVALAKIGMGSGALDRGRKMMEMSLQRSPHDLDAMCSLAGLLRKLGRERQDPELLEKAHHLYRDAYMEDPGYSYALGNYLIGEISRNRSLDPVIYSRAAILEAIDRCRIQVEVGTNLPWAHFDMGEYYLLLGEQKASRDSFLQAILGSHAEWMLKSSIDALKPLALAGLQIEGLDNILQLLELARSVRQRFPSPGTEAVRRSSPPPVLVIAGGCGGLSEAQLGELAVLQERLVDYQEGTILSGGTSSGVAGVVGNLQERDKEDNIHTVGYLPRGQWEYRDTRYSELVATEGSDYSVREPLQYWADLLEQGVNPAEVLIVGYNGGEISAFEYRLGFVLGARVVLLEGSGRAADEFLADPIWRPLANSRSESLSGEVIPVKLRGPELSRILHGQNPTD